MNFLSVVVSIVAVAQATSFLGRTQLKQHVEVPNPTYGYGNQPVSQYGVDDSSYTPMYPVVQDMYPVVQDPGYPYPYGGYGGGYGNYYGNSPNNYLPQMVLMKLLEDGVENNQVKFTSATDLDEQIKVLKAYARQLLTMAKYLPEEQYRGYYPISYSIAQLDMLSGGNPYIERLILTKILDDSVESFQKEIVAKADDNVAQLEVMRKFANRILLIGKVFEI